MSSNPINKKVRRSILGLRWMTTLLLPIVASLIGQKGQIQQFGHTEETATEGF